MDVFVDDKWPHFEYKQPDFFHFSEDSVLLSKSVFQCPFEFSMTRIKALDLCAGAGIVGIETMVQANSQREAEKFKYEFDFCELQDDFAPYIEGNLSRFFRQFPGNIYRPKVYFCSFEDLSRDQEFQGKYDLIVSNPPYFDPTRGRLSPQNQRKNICRFFLSGTREEFFNCLFQGLKQGGTGLMVFRKELQELQSWESAFSDAEKFFFRKNSAIFQKWKQTKGVVIYRFVKTSGL